MQQTEYNAWTMIFDNFLQFEVLCKTLFSSVTFLKMHFETLTKHGI